MCVYVYIYINTYVYFFNAYIYMCVYICIYVCVRQKYMNICAVPVAVLNKQNGLSMGKSGVVASCTAGFLD